MALRLSAPRYIVTWRYCITCTKGALRPPHRRLRRHRNGCNMFRQPNTVAVSRRFCAVGSACFHTARSHQMNSGLASPANNTICRLLPQSLPNCRRGRSSAMAMRSPIHGAPAKKAASVFRLNRRLISVLNTNPDLLLAFRPGAPVAPNRWACQMA